MALVHASSCPSRILQSALRSQCQVTVLYFWENSDFSDIHIFSDSQSAIGILKLGWQPSQHKHTVAEIKQKIQSLEHKNIMVNISWTPGHANIKGNEEADRLAKEASCEAATMKSDTDVVTMADIKQAAVKLGLSQW